MVYQKKTQAINNYKNSPEGILLRQTDYHAYLVHLDKIECNFRNGLRQIFGNDKPRIFRGYNTVKG